MSEEEIRADERKRVWKYILSHRSLRTANDVIEWLKEKR